MIPSPRISVFNEPNDENCLSVTLMTLVQAAVLAGASWLLSSVIDAREEVSIIKQQIQHVEADHDRVIRILIQDKHISETGSEAK